MDRLSGKRQRRDQRKRHVRKKIAGTAARPRLSVFKSHRNISVQAIDDTAGKTMVSAATLEKDMSKTKKSVEGGKAVGKLVGERLKGMQVKSVIFDRNGYRYHGIVKAVADGAREAGLEF
ncbi:MAG: 50S ribosomal protein L18 [spirochete symbiont of Stewartia floridana]|nr:MAG: 50S ribosomal protein L18 [spirochete symbiont of Stewartia floridana]